LTLLLNPLIKVRVRLDINAEEHLGVLDSAVLCALAEINAGFVRIDPHAIRMIRYEVRLTCKTWYPEAVIGISGKQREESWSGVCRVTYRYVQFICSHDVEAGVAKLPPKLMTDNSNFDGIMRFHGFLNVCYYSACRQEQNQDNQNRNYRPSCFYLGAAVNLREFPFILGSPLSEFDYCVSEPAEYKDKYCCRRASTMRDIPYIDCAGVESGLNTLIRLASPCAGSAKSTDFAKQWTARAVTFCVAELVTTSKLSR
jgi:hypothetical protein